MANFTSHNLSVSCLCPVLAANSPVFLQLSATPARTSTCWRPPENPSSLPMVNTHSHPSSKPQAKRVRLRNTRLQGCCFGEPLLCEAIFLAIVKRVSPSSLQNLPPTACLPTLPLYLRAGLHACLHACTSVCLPTTPRCLALQPTSSTQGVGKASRLAEYHHPAHAKEARRR